ncbi:MAG: hypothetical protein HG424_001695 [candidate division SR1 bacterium]|nr:hypothetical protein [candidate division SR1 bacterium]
MKDATNIANGKRWSCEGLHGGSTDTTCSLCDNGYVYNSATNRCDPKCGAGYTLHNGYCVKWKCVSPSTPGGSTPPPKPGKPHPPRPPRPGKPPVPGSSPLGWVKPASTEMPRGFLSLFAVSASTHEIGGVRTDGKGNCYDRHDNYIGKESYPGAGDCPVVHESYPQLIEGEDEEQPGATRPSGGTPPPPPRPGSTNRTAVCVDDKGTFMPEAFCINAGPKPVCDAQWACAVPTQSGTQGCINATTKDHLSLCRTDLSLNNTISCNDAIEVKKYCLPMRRRDCANDEYWFNGGSEWVIDDIMTGGFEKTLKWDPYIRKYKSSLPGEDAFGYEIVGACSRGEPKASASCKSISGKYDKYCGNLTNQGSCDMVNVYQKREDSSGPITIGIFKHSGQCSVSTYDFDNWEEQYDPVCPGIHQKSFKYMDSCEWSVRKEVVCQSKSSNAILNDSECNESEKPDYNMICGGRSSKSTPPTPPTPPASSSEDTSGLYRATSYSWSIHCIEGSSMYIGVCNQNDGIFMGDSISVSKGILWDHLGIYSPRPDKKIWIKDGFAYWDKDKTQPVEVGVYKLTQYGISGDEVPYRYFTVSGGYGPGYQLGRGRIVETLK